MSKAAILAATIGLMTIATASSAAPTVVYSNDFDGNVTTGGGATASQADGGGGTRAVNTVGGFAGNAFVNESGGNPAGLTTFTLSGLAAHTSIDVNFLFAFLDSWDGPGSNYPVGDYVGFFVDGTQVATLTACNYNYDSCTPDYAGGTFVYRGNVNNQFSGIDDRIIDAGTSGALSFAHTASTLTFGIQAYGPGWQGGSDESWGIDNLSISADLTSPSAAPEPASWAMMVSGFGLMGSVLRRRQRASVRFA